jgi:hypothetical protein
VNARWPLPQNQVASENIAVVFDGGPTPPKYKARWWHYVAAFFWNLYRKPLVWKRQRELVSIFRAVKASLESSVLPVLWYRRKDCQACYNAYLSLKPQIFLSQIKMILERMACEDHGIIFRTFLLTYKREFEQSEQLARWINNL